MVSSRNPEVCHDGRFWKLVLLLWGLLSGTEYCLCSFVGHPCLELHYSKGHRDTS